MGKKLSFTMETAVDFNVVSATTAIDDIEHNLNKIVVLGNRSYRVSRFEAVGTTAGRAGAPASAPARFNATIVAGDAPATPSTAAGATTASGPATTNSMQFMILDGTGKAGWRGSGMSAGAFNAGFAATAAPYKLEIKAFSGTVTLPIHLQFKDVPLP
jgi:hypothetical protein